MVCDHRAADGDRAGGGEVDLLFRLGQRLLLVLLEQLGGGIDVVLGPIHAAKVRPRGGSGHPAQTCVCASRRVRAPPCPPRAAGGCATKPVRLVYRLAPSGGERDSESILSIRLPSRGVIKHLFTVDKAIQWCILSLILSKYFKLE